MWNAYRHVAAFRGLLQWTGWWETAIAAIVSAVGAAGSLLRGLPWPITVTIAIRSSVGNFDFLGVHGLIREGYRWILAMTTSRLRGL
jgi:hypothetical protein